MSAKMKIGVLAASGYTGAEAVRILARHRMPRYPCLKAKTHAGKAMDEVFTLLFIFAGTQRLKEWEKVDWTQARLRVRRAAARHDTGDHRGRHGRQSGHQILTVGRFPAPPTWRSYAAMVRQRGPRATA